MSKKKIVPALLATAMAVPMATPAFAEQLTDIQKSWAKTQIQSLVDKGILSGMGNGKYEPAKTMTRAEIAVALTRALDLPLDASAAAKFKDVPNWAKPYVGALVKAGLVAGMDANTYGSNLKVTREQLAVFYVRALGLESLAKEAQGLNLTFKDAASIADYAKKHVALAAKIGFIHGFPDGTFGPRQNADRAQLAKLTYDLYFQSETFVKKANEMFAAVNVQNVTAANGTVTVTFDKALAQAPQAADLNVKQAVNGSSPMAVTASDITLSADKKSVSFKTPEIAEKDEKQSVVVSVAYRGGEAKSAAAFTIASKYPQVESVTALNPYEIKVMFNKEVDKTSAENEDNYTLQGDAHPAEAKLDADKKSVILRLSAPLANEGSYKVNVTNVKDTKYNTMQAFEDTAKLFSDKEAPKLLKAEVTSDSNLKLTFSEPVKNTMTVKVDGAVVSGPVVSSQKAGDYSVTVSGLGNELVKPGTHNVTVYNVADTLANNPNVLSMASASYTVEADSSAPTVSELTAVGKDTFKVKFSERLAAAPAIAVKKGTLVLTATVEADKADSTAYIVKVASPDGMNNPLYGANEDEIKLDVNVKNHRDTAGFLGAEYNGTVTLSEQSGAPSVVNATLNKIDAQSRTLSIKFDKDIESADKAKITVRKDGVTLPVANVKVNNTAKDTLDIVLSSDVTVATGTYNVALGAGAVEDADGNKNAALNTTVTHSQATSDKLEVTANVLSGNVIELVYNDDMDNRAIDTDNYTLDGKALPEGTTAEFIVNKKKVHITLPEGTFEKTTEEQLKINSNLSSENGKVVKSNTQTEFLLPFTDNTKPELEKAQFQVANTSDTTTDKIRLTFSENLAALGSNNADFLNDFVVKVNGTAVSVKAVTDGTAGDNVVTLELNSTVNATQGATVNVNDAEQNLNITDAAGNKLTKGTAVTASEKVQ